MYHRPSNGGVNIRNLRVQLSRLSSHIDTVMRGDRSRRFLREQGDSAEASSKARIGTAWQRRGSQGKGWSRYRWGGVPPCASLLRPAPRCSALPCSAFLRHCWKPASWIASRSIPPRVFSTSTFFFFSSSFL